MRRSAISALAGLALAAILPFACTQNFDVFEPSGSGGGGAGGSSTHASSGSGGCAKDSDCDDDDDCTTDACNGGKCTSDDAPAGTACTAGGGKVCDGAGKCVECADPMDCGDTGNACILATCEMNTCGSKNADDLTPTATGQNAGDCKLQVCDGVGGTKIVDDDDPMDDGNDCTDDVCNAGMNEHNAVAPGTACAQNGGGVCGSDSKSGTCVECLDDGDCMDPTKPTCDTNNDNFVCVSIDCMNNVQDGNETGLDCGGPDCGDCPNGQGCDDATDCASNYCNQAGTCAACNNNNQCAGPDYCNQATGACEPEQADGATCNNDGECASDNCVDGFCCDTACNGTCEACSAAKKGQGNDGVCGDVAAGTDPNNNCATDAVSTCDQNGSCNGMGACQLYPANTVCSPQTCAGGTQQNVDMCNGTGMCVNGGSTPCSPYVCNGNACGTSCNANNQCAGTHYCSNMVCVPKLTNGTACANGNECTSNNCVDGVCCGTPLCNPCRTCNGTSPGMCTNVPAGMSDPGSCNAPMVCTAAQTCVNCLADAQCMAPTPKCNLPTNTCVACLGDVDCVVAGMTKCNIVTHACVQCVDNTTCMAPNPNCNIVTGVCGP